MSVPELSIQIKNIPGQLVQISAILAEADINILAVAASSTGKTGWVRLVVDNSKMAEEALDECGYSVNVGESVVVRLQDEPGSLDTVLRVLSDNSVNVDYIYTYSGQDDGAQLFIIGVQTPGKVEKILKAAHIEIADLNF